ncbi:MAG TPA: YafY family protein [Ktedonobacteraceae bacterium]
MIYSPVTRLLTTLDLLQSRPSVTAAQLAERLEVEGRSVRRYITMLQDMGIPVEAERGRYGGYKLRPNFKLPPLMWTEDEALAITLGLQAARQLGLTQTAPIVESALAKVERVLPPALRERVQAIQEMVTVNLPAQAQTEVGEFILSLSSAAAQCRRVQLSYQGREGKSSERLFDSYGLLYHKDHWYTIGYCHLRQDTRIFRLDRVLAVEPRAESFTRPPHFDSLAYAIQSFAEIPSRWLVEVALQADMEQVRQHVPAEFASLEETSTGLLLRAYDDDLAHAARFLANLGCPFRVLQPPELVAELRKLAEQILKMTGA